MTRIQGFRGLVCGVVLALTVGQALAVDGVALELGVADRARIARLGVQWDWSGRWLQRDGWHLGGYWDAAVGYWDHTEQPAGYSVKEIGVTPVFRWQRNDRQGPYAEAGIGAHLLSRTTFTGHYSTAFQFGEHVGIGYRFGERDSYELGYRFQHLSNGGIKQPNDGINFHQLRLQRHF